MICADDVRHLSSVTQLYPLWQHGVHLGGIHPPDPVPAQHLWVSGRHDHREMVHGLEFSRRPYKSSEFVKHAHLHVFAAWLVISYSSRMRLEFLTFFGFRYR